MKKFNAILIVALGVVAIALMPSCKKDSLGAYKPSKKLQKIYQQFDEDKDLINVFNWDKKGQLASLEYWWGGSLDRMELFTYEDNHITRVEDLASSEAMAYHYDGNQLSKAELVWGDDVYYYLTFTYQDGKINSFTLWEWEPEPDPDLEAKEHLNPFFGILPNELSQPLLSFKQECAKNNPGKDAEIFNVFLTWEGDNISKMVVKEGSATMTVIPEYDDKNNPFYCFLGSEGFHTNTNDFGLSCYTKNNIIKSTSASGGWIQVITNLYAYDEDGYPIEHTNILDQDTLAIYLYEY